MTLSAFLPFAFLFRLILGLAPAHVFSGIVALLGSSLTGGLVVVFSRFLIFPTHVVSSSTMVLTGEKLGVVFAACSSEAILSKAGAKAATIVSTSGLRAGC